MSKRALGEYWRERSDKEKKEFVELFTELLLNNYIEKIYHCSREEIVCLGEKLKNNCSKVKIKFITNKGKKIKVNFCLLYKQGKWKVYDMIVKRISLTNHYRRQFDSILDTSSYEKLFQKLKKKIAKQNHQQIKKLALNTYTHY